MQRTLVILVVGLSPSMVGSQTPHLQALAARGGLRPLRTITPAVTCSVQSTLVTGRLPSEHGVVANGWYDRERAEVGFWKQSNRLVAGPKLWDRARELDPDFTVAKLFWWYNMYADVDWSATPRPIYRADGRKIPDHYTHPAALHDELDLHLGRFPLFRFWGPTADLVSSRWIADATLHIMATRKPTLALTYLPHLDYNLQRLGPDLGHPTIQQDLRDIDAICGDLIELADRQEREIIVVSEYGIVPVDDAVHVNRALREAGLLSVRHELGSEQLDAGASEAFAVADHQLAHIYVRDSGRIEHVRALLESLDGVEQVLDRSDQRAIGLAHARSGELVAIARSDRWFSYYYWLDEALAPDYARTVDIHRKPGYDPVELFFDPALRWPRLSAGWRLARRKLGMRGLMDLISSRDTALVKGSHGRPTDRPEDGPLVIGSNATQLGEGPIEATAFADLVLDHVFPDRAARRRHDGSPSPVRRIAR